MRFEGQIYGYEAKSMAQFILEGHNLQETANEYGTSRETVRRRLRNIGYTYAELRELYEKRQHNH